MKERRDPSLRKRCGGLNDSGDRVILKNSFHFCGKG
jgi:hypothetical protein